MRENTKQEHTKVSIHLHLRVYDQPLHLDRLRELVQERSNAARLQLRQCRVPINSQRLGDRRQSRRSVTCQKPPSASPPALRHVQTERQLPQQQRTENIEPKQTIAIAIGNVWQNAGVTVGEARTEPLPGRDTQVPVPLPVLDSLLRDEPALERCELCVRRLHPLRRPDEVPNGTRRGSVPQYLLQEFLQPVRERDRESVEARAVLVGMVVEGAVCVAVTMCVQVRVFPLVVSVWVLGYVRMDLSASAGNLVKHFEELLLRVLLLLVECQARSTQAGDTLAEAREVCVGVGRGTDRLDPVEIIVEFIRVVGGIEREDERVDQTKGDQAQVLCDGGVAEEAGVSVRLLPGLRIVDRVVVVRGIRRGPAKALVHARNLFPISEYPVHALRLLEMLRTPRRWRNGV